MLPNTIALPACGLEMLEALKRISQLILQHELLLNEEKYYHFISSGFEENFCLNSSIIGGKIESTIMAIITVSKFF